MEELERIIQMAGFIEVEVIAKPVSKEYEERWGRNLPIGEYIMSSSITAKKQDKSLLTRRNSFEEKNSIYLCT